MKRVLYTLTAAVVFACTHFGAAAAAANDGRIDSLYRNLVRAIDHKDLDAIMSAYANDGSLFVFDVVPPREYVGWPAYRKDWKSLLASLRTAKVSLGEFRVVTSGDVAYDHYVLNFASVDREGHAETTVIRATDVLRKRGGAWSIVQEHFSVPFDYETGKADPMSRP
jgi:ketosteroid isomerase-like protein